MSHFGACRRTYCGATDFQIDCICCIPFPNWGTHRDVRGWDAFALDENVCVTALRSFKKYDPGAQCGSEYHTMYRKFARKQKCEFGILVVQGKNAYTCFKLTHLLQRSTYA